MLSFNEAWLLGYDVPKEKGVFDTFIKVKDIPDYVYRFSKTEAEMFDLLGRMFSNDEILLLRDYKLLTTEGKEYIRQTMKLALKTYMKEGDDQ
jgi:hypothetical protein